MAAESSVVIALAEVRRLERERRQREAEAKAARLSQAHPSVDSGRCLSQSYPAFDPGPPPRSSSLGFPAIGHPHPPRRTAEFSAFDQISPTLGHGSAASSFPGFGSATYAEAPKPRSVAGPVFLTLLLCGAGAAAGYWKLQQMQLDTARAHALALARVETERNDAVEQKARAEQEARTKMAALEARIRELEGRHARPSDPEALAIEAIGASVATPGAAPKAAIGGTPTAGIAGKPVAKVTAKPARLAPKPKVLAKPAAKADKSEKALGDGPVPKIIKEQPLPDDPLGGLKL